MLSLIKFKVFFAPEKGFKNHTLAYTYCYTHFDDHFQLYPSSGSLAKINFLKFAFFSHLFCSFFLQLNIVYTLSCRGCILTKILFEKKKSLEFLYGLEEIQFTLHFLRILLLHLKLPY